MSPFNKIIPNQITEIEISERVKYLQAIVDKSPKLNLEVNLIKIISKFFIITGDKFKCASSGSKLENKRIRIRKFKKREKRWFRVFWVPNRY